MVCPARWASRIRIEGYIGREALLAANKVILLLGFYCPDETSEFSCDVLMNDTAVGHIPLVANTGMPYATKQSYQSSAETYYGNDSS